MPQLTNDGGGNVGVAVAVAVRVGDAVAVVVGVVVRVGVVLAVGVWVGVNVWVGVWVAVAVSFGGTVGFCVGAGEPSSGLRASGTYTHRLILQSGAAASAPPATSRAMSTAKTAGRNGSITTSRYS